MSIPHFPAPNRAALRGIATFADMVIIPVSTKKLGGEGVAQMEITIGEFGGNAQTGYYQVVTYKMCIRDRDKLTENI